MATATGLVLTVAQTLLSAMQSKEVRDLCSVFEHKIQLAELERTVGTIQAVLLDAESKQTELTNQGNDWLGKLKDAVYDADDLFDDLNTVAQLHKRMSGGKISKEVRRFFSTDNQLLFAAKTSGKIKALRKKLDSISKDRTQFGFSDVTDVYVPLKRKEGTYSYVNETSIIGRDVDKEDILGLLLPDSDSSVTAQDNVSFVSIVGIGGLGKTALAQLVFQDGRIKSAFELCLWVCVSEDFGMKEILSMMLEESTEHNIEVLQKKVRQRIEGQRYFLVLDDVWEEDRNQWSKLTEFLLLGAKGSKVIVTTRSKKVAIAIGDYPMHELKGLSDESSWCLFETIAFNQGSRHVDDALVLIGKDIVKKCANVPLSIRVIGSMLFDQDESKWLLFQKNDFAKMSQAQDGIMPILKYSYYHLTPQLKTCFSYCALFPKDCEIKKEMLINLWSAEGCLEDPNDVRQIEDVGEEYFSFLLHRCFFQDMRCDEYGEVSSVKMHDLIHDLAQEVAGKESCLLMDSTSHLNEKIRHVSVSKEMDSTLLPCLRDTLGKLRTMRTLLRPYNGDYNDCVFWGSNVAVILAKCRRLRVLDLRGLNIQALGNTLSNLSHLRYLDLSRNTQLKMLPKSILKLHNLQVLSLRGCSGLKELPEDLRQLANLRHLDIAGCDALTHMPAGMGSMTGLSKLSMYVLGGGSSNRVQICQLRDLMPLMNLRGELLIKFTEDYSHDVTNTEKVMCLLNKKHIKALTVEGVPLEEVIDERILESLQPHHELKSIEIFRYKNTELPGWAATLATTLEHLVNIRLRNFQGLQHLPQLSQLRHLKKLLLEDMPCVEYMEDDNGFMSFFPSLEELSLSDFPKLKGWWRSEVAVETEAVIPTFSRLRSLVIIGCPNITSFPGIPNVKSMYLREINEALGFGKRREEASPKARAVTSSSSNISYCLEHLPQLSQLRHLKVLQLADMPCVEYMEDNNGFMSFFPSLEVLSLSDFPKLKRWWRSEVAVETEAVIPTFSRLRSLEIKGCPNITSFPGIRKSLSRGGMECMTNLESLYLEDCEKLKLEEEEDGMPWKAFHKLTILFIYDLPKVVKLPKGMQYLTSLRYLYIKNCENLEDLPEWLDNLTSLRELRITRNPKLKSLPEAICRVPSLVSLSIYKCDGLRERCREPDGEDWPKIRHISDLYVQ